MKKIIISIIAILISVNLFAQIGEYSKKANEYHEKGDFANAVIYAKKAVALDNSNMKNLSNLCCYQLKKGDFNDALNTIKKANTLLKNNPNNGEKPYILINLAHSYLLTNNIDKAKEIYDNNIGLRVGKYDWYDAVLINLSDFKILFPDNVNLSKIQNSIVYKYISYLDSLLNNNFNNTAVKLTDSEIKYFQTKGWTSNQVNIFFKYDTDGVTLEELKDEETTTEDFVLLWQMVQDDIKEYNLKKYVKIAELYLQTNTPEKAISMLNKSIFPDLDINLEEAKIKFTNKRWEDYFSYKDKDKRKNVLDSLIKNSPNNFILLADRGLCYFYEGQFNKALTDLNKSIIINPQNYVWSYIFRAETKKLLNDDSYKNDLNKALDICNKAIQINKSSENYLTRAIIYAFLEQYDKAIADCDNNYNKYRKNYITFDIKFIIYGFGFQWNKEKMDESNKQKENAISQNELLQVETNLISKIEDIREYNIMMNQSLVIINQGITIMKLGGKTDKNEREKLIDNIAQVELYNNLFRYQPDYFDKMKIFKENLNFLQKELNITEQEIQQEMSKLRKN